MNTETARKTTAPFTEGQVTLWLEDIRRGRITERVEFSAENDARLRARVGKRGIAFSVFVYNPATRAQKRVNLGTIKAGTKLAREFSVRSMLLDASRLVADIAQDRHETNVERMAGSSIGDAASRRSVTDLLDQYLTEKRVAGRALAPATADCYRDQLPRMLGARMRRPIGELTQDVVAALQLERAQASKQGARMALAALSAVCKFYGMPNLASLARARGQVVGDEVRDGRLELDQAQKLAAFCWQQAMKAPHTRIGTNAAMTVVAIATGARSLLIRNLRWDWIDFTARTISVPKEYSKDKRAYVQPLTPRVAQLLRSRKRASGSALVFPLASDRTQPAKFCAAHRATLPFDCSPHDARKVFALELEDVCPDLFASVLMYHVGGSIRAKHYVGANPWASIVKKTRPYAEKVEAILLSKIDDPRTLATVKRFHVERQAKARVARAARDNVTRPRRRASLRAAA
jgi:integrase